MYSRYKNQTLFSPLPLDVFYFPHYQARAAMAGPTCYYHAYRHLLDIQGVHSVPTYVEKMMTEIDRADDKDETIRILYQTIVEHADDLLWMADEVWQLNHDAKKIDESAMQLSEESSSDEDNDWAQDFIDEYGIEGSIARLLNLHLSQVNVKKMSIAQLSSLLHNHGPIATGMIKYTQLPHDLQQCEMVTAYTSHTHETRNVYHADNYLTSCEGHYVFVIGIESSRNKVFFIDPNYPTILLSLSFELFKKNLSIGEYAHVSKNTINPSPVKFIEVAEKKLTDRIYIQFSHQ